MSDSNKQVYDNIDKLHKSYYGEKNLGNTNDIKYWYDMNKKEFINPIEKYDGIIYVKNDFNIKYTNSFFEGGSFKNKIAVPYLTLPLQTINSSLIPTKFRINLYLDNNLNIFIPDISTIIIINYMKFPQFVLDSQYHKHFNKPSYIVLNEKNTEDKKCLDVMSNVNINFTTYLTSKDQRDKFNDGKLFQYILDLLDYNEMIKDVKIYLDLSLKLRVHGNYSDKRESSLDKKIENIEDIKDKEIEKIKSELESKIKIIEDKDKEIEKIKSELESKIKIIEDNDKEIERLKIEKEELRKFYIDS